MIDKKEIVSWFKELESYKRIDAMYTLIGMCLPFELRFLGSVLEELGRRDSQELRGIELRVNNPQELAADIASCQNGEPTDKKIRRKMAIYLALIRACSRSCVNELFKTLEGWGDMDLVKFGDVENTLGELLLVYTMASLHPVFSFDQRNKCADILARIEECQKLLHRSQQQHQTAQQEQPSTTTTAAAATPMGQGHILTGHQHIHAPMQVLPPNYHYTVQQPPMAQMMHADATVSHPMSVDGIPLIHTNLGIPTEYTVGPAPPGTLWAVRPSVQAHAPQQPPSIDVCYVLQPHLPQSPSPMLSQQSSPSQSRTASPSRSTTSGGNTLMQQSQQQQQQQQHSRNTQQQQQSQRNNTLRNSRRPSAETTPPPAPQTMQQQQQQQQQQQPPHQLQSSQLIITDMIPSHIKNLDDVDIDEQVLMKYVVRAKPLVSDYINRRNTPLRIDIYKGSIASSEECLLGVDAVIAIELIEHLYPEELNNVPYNVFGYSRPKLAIFSTPNFDYNPLFNLTFSRGFRHEDHKFEWTRKQFEDWCYNICYRFPNYQVALIGVGDPPASQNNVGHVTQIGVFIRNDIRDIDLNDDIYSSEFPTIKDDRTRDQKLLDEIKYHINRYINMSKYFNRELEWCEIPIDNILEFMHPMITTIEELREFLIKNHCKMDCNNKVLVEQMQVGEDTDSESSSSGKSIEGINVSQISFVDIIEKWD